MKSLFRTTSAAVCLTLGLFSQAVHAEQEPFKVGLILNLTGPIAAYSRQVEEGAHLYMAEHGDEVNGRKIELIVKDDAMVADTTKRLAQELIVQEKVDVLAGFGITPLALAVAPLLDRAKVPGVVMAASSSTITDMSPWMVRTSYSMPQVTSVIAKYAAEQGYNNVVTLTPDYAPGVEAETSFGQTFEQEGRKVSETMRFPPQNPDFSPFLQKIADQKPDAVYVFAPGFVPQFLKQFKERGLDSSGVVLLADGGVSDDLNLNEIGEDALPAITGHHYSAAHDSPENAAFVAAFKAAYDGKRPNFMAVSGYDGMELIYAALAQAGPDAKGQALLDAMKQQSWISPRGPVEIDPDTRELVQNVYMRRVEERDGEFWSIEFQTYDAVKDPSKSEAN